jgi:starvation-inducible DNA-binding protein
MAPGCLAEKNAIVDEAAERAGNAKRPAGGVLWDRRKPEKRLEPTCRSATVPCVILNRLIPANMKPKPSSKRQSDTLLAKSLNQVLADSYALMSLTHLAHWNVEGPGFFALHTAFQTQYEELFVAIDEIAERIRAIDAYAVGGLGALAVTARMEEFVSPLAQENYVSALLTANEKLVADATSARDLAGESNDPETQDLMTARITLHQKTIWMLRSFLK